MTVLNVPYRKMVDIVRDPIYNYIDFTKPSKEGEITEKDIIDSLPLQRLRQIHQLQTAWMVYPGADHTRFQHSLGTMHLSGIFANHLYKPFFDITPKQVSLPEINSIVEEIRLAGLLHDVGHGPFGHLLDRTYLSPEFGINHETISQKIINEEFKDKIIKIHRSPYGEFKEDLDVNRIVNLVKFDNVDSFDINYRKSLYRILHGIWTADSLDFIQRDAYFCGTKEYGIIDYERLIKSSIMSEAGGLALYITSESALESFIFSRIFMFTNVYYHRTARAFDISIGKLLPDTMKELDIGNPIKEPDSYEKYLHTTEYSLFSDVLKWSRESNGEKKKLGEAWRDLLLDRNIEWRLTYRAEAKPTQILGKDLPLKKEDIEKIIEPCLPKDTSLDDIEIDIPSLDIRSPLLIKEMDYGLYDPEEGKIVDQRGIHHFMMSLLPNKIIWYSVFAKKDKRKEIGEALKKETKRAVATQDTSH